MHNVHKTKHTTYAAYVVSCLRLAAVVLCGSSNRVAGDGRRDDAVDDGDSVRSDVSAFSVCVVYLYM